MTRLTGWMAGLAFLLAIPAEAQLPQASATALGMGYNMAASARGFAAVANNPAGLARRDSPGFSIAILPISLGSGLGPVGLGDLATWNGQLVPAPTKDEWLELATAAGGQAGSLELGVTPIALSAGPVGLQLSTVVGGELNLDPAAVELLLYGNAGRTGAPRDFDLAGTRVDGYVLSTAALSFGTRVSDGLHLGATGKYTVGNGLLVGRDAGSVVSADPLGIAIEFPTLVNRSDNPEYDNGSGFGLDLGAIWEGPGITLGVTVQNVVNTFGWKLDGLAYVPGEALFDADTTFSDFDEQPSGAAPVGLREAARSLTLEPVVAVGAEITLPLLRVQAGVRKRETGGLRFGPEFHAGLGVELTALSAFRPRVHAAVVTEGVQLGGGASLVLGPFNLTGGAALRTGDLRDTTLGMLTISFGGN